MTDTVTNIEQQELPSGWKWVKLGDVCYVTDYVANGSFASLKENVIYKNKPDFAVLVRLKDFSNGWDSAGFVFVDEHAYKFLSKSSLTVGDVVVANVGSVGRAFMVRDLGLPMTIAPNAVLIKPLNEAEITKDFIFRWITSDIGQSSLVSITAATAQPKFNKTHLKGF